MQEVFGHFAAVLALGAVASASASAAQWYVNGKATTSTSTEKLWGFVKMEEPVVLSVPKAKLTITCKEIELDGEESELRGRTAVYLRDIDYYGCKTTEPSTGCALASLSGEEYASWDGLYIEGEATAEGKSTEDQLRLTPVTGGSL
jgi:hypothetical protein